MKIAWLTPFGLQSAIGKFSREVTEELAAMGHHVVIYRTEIVEIAGGQRFSSRVPVGWAGDVPPRDLRRGFDATVCNLGDYYPNHAAIMPFLDELPCVGIFHDWCLFNFNYGELEHAGRLEDLPFRLESIYGAGIPSLDAGDSKGFEEFSRRFPMVEWFASRTAAAVGHAGFYLERLRGACPGPVGCFPLAHHPLPVGLPVRQRWSRDKLRLVTFGNLNANKRAASVIRAVSSSDLLREAVEYDLIGQISEQENDSLTSLVRELGFCGMRIHGYLPEEELCKWLGMADAICCLRWPALEGASSSVVHAMMTGRPVIVTRTGCYDEIPDELALKIDPEKEIEELADVLTALVRNEEAGRLMGGAARAWAEQRFSPRRYAENISGFLQDFLVDAPLVEVARTLASQLGALGIREDDPGTQQIAAVVNGMFPAIRRRNEKLVAEAPRSSSFFDSSPVPPQWRILNAKDRETLAAFRPACPICKYEAEKEKFMVLLATDIFHSGDLERYGCPECGAIFGPRKVRALASEILRRDYEELYEYYSESDNTEAEIRAFRLLKPSKQGRYLNYGAGRWSHSVQQLREEGYDVHAFDPYTPDMEAEGNTPASGLEQASFDGIYSNNVIEHFIEPLEDFRRMAGLVKKGGLMSHATDCFSYKIEFSRFHTIFYTGQSLDRLADKLSLTIMERVKEERFQAVLFRLDHALGKAA